MKYVLENTGEKIHKRIWQGFPGFDTKNKSNKIKDRQFEVHQILRLLCIQGHNNRVERLPTE